MPQVAEMQTRDSARDCDFVPVRSAAQPEEIEGYLALWGSPDQRDCYQTYFSRENPPMMDLDFLPIPLRYAHGQDAEIGKEAIGKIVRVWLDERGIKFRAFLEKARSGYGRIADEIRRGILGTSSGTSEYLAEFADDGRFVSWPVAEVSLTDRPCESRMPAVATVRSMPDSKHLQLEVRPVEQRQAAHVGDPRDCGCDEQASATVVPQRSKTTTVRTKTMPKAQPMPPTDGGEDVQPPKKGRAGGGLTLEMLGLDTSATPADVYSAVCELLGDAAGEAYFDSFTGPAGGPEEVEPEDQESMLSMPDDPEADGRPSDFIGDEENEDLQNGQPGSSITRAALSLDQKLKRALAAQNKASQPRSAKKVAPRTDELAELRKQNRMLRQLVLQAGTDDKPTPRADRRQSPSGGPRAVNMRDLRYDGSSAGDLAYAVKLLESVGKRPSDELVRATAYKIGAEIEKSTLVGSDMTVQYMTPFRSISEARSMDLNYLRNPAYRANEVMGDVNTGFGSNYVGVFYDTTLWLKTRAMPIWQMLLGRGMEEKIIPVGYASDVIPLEGADFTWYRVPETVSVDATGRPLINIPASKAGTSSSTLSVKTLGALVYYSVLLEEDSIVPMASELNRKANIQVQEQIENVLINGDTATGTGNLNLKNGTVNATDVFNYTTADGLVKAALIQNSGLNARQASGLNDTDYQLLFAKLGNNGITGSDPTKLLFLVDPLTGLATDRLPIMKTKDVNSAATIENGHAKEMYGVPVLRSGQMALADLTGYIDSVTAANNKFGRIVCVRPDQWVVGFKRNVTMEFFRDVPGQSNGMVITLRLGLVNRDATQAGAISYNVTVS